MPRGKRLEYLNRRLRAAVRYAYNHSVAIKNKFDSAGLKPKDILTMKDLEELPTTRKSDLMEFQKKDPPFGGFVGVPIHELRRIYVSPALFTSPERWNMRS